ncbi:hypothetical protein ACFLXC_06655 [Chloroflexota bacterium]
MEIKDSKRIDQDFKGTVTILIQPGGGVDYKKIEEFQKQVKSIENVKLLWTGWAEKEGHSITVSLQQAMKLLGILRGMSAVEGVSNKGKNIKVTLNTTATQNEQKSLHP